ncbi:hypothetical protein AB4238_05585 [Shewanella sp. 10N.286.45.A1]|uniref:hypothetical protein n=1 Tax=Shewanella sp. 10N.286.45.A1 TaxID=3229694 RepID=UPI00355449E4
MSCNQLCTIINNSICMNLCAMGLEPSSYRLTKQGNYWLLQHSQLKVPLARLHESEYLAIEQWKNHLSTLDKVTESKY